MTLHEACRKWVNEFNVVPQSALEKIYQVDESITEITPPSVNDRVYVYGEGEGEITKVDEDGYEIELDSGETTRVEGYEFEVVRESFFPMWGYMWTFGDSIDEDWARGTYCPSHLQEMADCGFRIYDSEDYGLVFGIDGAGYDFYIEHWIPLYEARGLRWHEEEIA